uniref:HYDIN/VesB/CFA65-like Ig-like domain-containing protein n=1 Tax=Cynoglossus semilaevis TaxID=244447 RepID=A0A3P8WZA5_CYNSE
HNNQRAVDLGHLSFFMHCIQCCEGLLKTRVVVRRMDCAAVCLQVTPSVYTHEMLLSTEERLANTKEVHSPRILELLDMSETTHHKSSMVDLDQPLFQPYPSELVFQNFTASETYKLQLRLLNMDKVIRLEMQDSEFFRAHVPDQALGRIAPSCCATFSIFFSPQENKDYHHTLVFVTDRERFAVAVRAIGPRAILNFRDELRLPICPVKGSTERLQQVINVGNSTAKFELRTQRPFAVTPSCGTLEPGENLQVVVTFNPMNVGDHSQDLLVHYHTGEDVYVTLFGTCEELDVHLRSDSLMLKSTYISLANVHTVSLTNRSDSVLQYHWSVWPTQEEEDLSLLRYWRFNDLCFYFCSGRETSVCLALSDDCITLEPAKGEIWPKMTQQFTVVFKPKEAEPYQETIYCNITGRQSRLPLTIRGEGLGPQLWLDYSLMNMKNVFMGDRNCYEVLLSNKGLIDASFKFSRPDTFYGRCFSFSPEGGVIPFGSSMTVRVTFQSHTLGTFSEELLLTVEGQPELLTLTFRGCVVGPTFHFDVLELNFGDVAFGFPQTMTCTLFNTSFVPMNFVLRVLGDGQGSPSVTSDRQVWTNDSIKMEFLSVSFHIFNLVLRSSCVCLVDVEQVTLCSNTVRTYRLALVVDVEGVGEEIKTLPINARSEKTRQKM